MDTYHSEKFGCEVPSYGTDRMKSNVMNFWQRVYELQNRNGFDTYEMANWAGIDEEEYTELQKSGKEPDLQTAVGIAGGLGVSVEYLVSGNSYDVYKKRNEHLYAELKELKDDVLKINSRIAEIMLAEESANIDLQPIM